MTQSAVDSFEGAPRKAGKSKGMDQRVFSGSPYEPKAGFCRALRVGDRIVVAGTAPIEDDGSNTSPGEVEVQARRCFKIATDAVSKLGGHASDVVRTRMYLTNPADFELVSQVHGEFFAPHPPVATAVVVAGLLDPEWLVEIGLEAEIRPHVRALTPEDRQWIEDNARGLFGATKVISRGSAHQVSTLEGFVAYRDSRRLGFATYRVENGQCELVTVDAFQRGQGVGSQLLEAVVRAAREQACERLWLITTNDNIDAIRFYQRRGMRIAAVYPRAIDEVSRKLKPSIPEVGNYQIPLRDELELELEL